MKKNRFSPGLPFITLMLVLFSGCKKQDKADTPVTPASPGTGTAAVNKEVQSALDAAWATYVITDIEQMCAFMGENELQNTFYSHVPGTLPLNQVIVERNEQSKDLRMLFNDSPCLDGRFRQGTVFMRYSFDPVRKPGANPNSEYYHEYGFVGQLSLLNYRVDGWLVENYDPKFPAYVYNERENLIHNPKVTNHKWKIAGRFRLTHPTDSLKERSMDWDGEIFKTLDNTSDPLVYTLNRSVPVTWSLAVCSYSGNVNGLTHSADKFSMEVGTTNNPVVRDFTCKTDPALKEHHPFIKGVANYTTGTVHPCHIYFGIENHPELSQCDSIGTIRIKGIVYRVNYRK